MQNLSDATEKVDTSFTLVFYSTEVLLPKVKPTVSGSLTVEEAQPVSFSILCEAGNFPIDDILFTSSTPITNYLLVKHCDDKFEWTPPYDFVKETDSARVKVINLSFIGSARFKIRDTANVRIIVKDALNYPVAKQDYEQAIRNVRTYILQLKYTFFANR